MKEFAVFATTVFYLFAHQSVESLQINAAFHALCPAVGIVVLVIAVAVSNKNMFIK